MKALSLYNKPNSFFLYTSIYRIKVRFYLPLLGFSEHYFESYMLNTSQAKRFGNEWTNFGCKIFLAEYVKRPTDVLLVLKMRQQHICKHS